MHEYPVLKYNYLMDSWTKTFWVNYILFGTCTQHCSYRKKEER